ncbi:sensor histidine kinase [Gryllotalpicola reticulitermitis]|uniref:Sensor-like histidine kinase SenX3 n=1 Tax=Gryllotalpicola reticulitermitis TaxID=1184153 RepID=A0ABV8Q1Z9_9MICO
MHSPAWLVLVALLAGAVIGGGFVAILSLALRRSRQAVQVSSSGVPDGVDQVLDAMDSAGIVADASLNVVKATAKAFALALVSNARLTYPELIDIVERVRRTGALVDVELDLQRGRFKDASLRVHVRASLLGSRFVLLLIEDRTEAYRLEAVRRDFVANISHELKTPIGAIGLLSEALHTAADDPEQVRMFAERLSVESTRIARLTQDIIELSRLQAVDAIANAERVEIDHVIAAAVDQNRVESDAHAIELVAGAPTGAVVYGDPKLLVTAVDNLISNAIRYSPDSSRIGVGSRAADGVVEIAVTDQGEGIPEADQARIFERFFRVDQARSRTTGGTGLGLSIVKHAVQNHGGDVRVWSQPGMGSTFTIRLPEADQPATALQSSASQASARLQGDQNT